MTCLSETLITPEQFAEVLCDDLELPNAQFVQPIASSIRQQCDQFSVDMIPEDEEDRRVIIKVRLPKRREGLALCWGGREGLALCWEGREGLAMCWGGREGLALCWGGRGVGRERDRLHAGEDSPSDNGVISNSFEN